MLSDTSEPFGLSVEQIEECAKALHRRAMVSGHAMYEWDEMQPSYRGEVRWYVDQTVRWLKDKDLV